VSFAWGTVYDPSEPVSYSFQIAKTRDFQQPLLEEDNLSVTQFNLTKAEELLPNRQYTSYYWRVRATDGASNVGAWSAAVPFRVEPSGTLPQWANYLLLGIGVLLVLVMSVRILIGVLSLKTEKKA
jgi:hypothetical protein